MVQMALELNNLGPPENECPPEDECPLEKNNIRPLAQILTCQRSATLQSVVLNGVGNFAGASLTNCDAIIL